MLDIRAFFHVLVDFDDGIVVKGEFGHTQRPGCDGFNVEWMSPLHHGVLNSRCVHFTVYDEWYFMLLDKSQRDKTHARMIAALLNVDIVLSETIECTSTRCQASDITSFCAGVHILDVAPIRDVVFDSTIPDWKWC